MNPIGFALAVAGLFSLGSALFDWEWFMNQRKARFLVGVMGRTGARLFYGLLGLALVVLGALLGLGLIEDKT